MADKLNLGTLSDEDYKKAVKELAGKDDKFFITLLSDPETLARVEQWISTRCLPLDKITGGGFPVRRITEIYGDNSTGKTLLATQAAIATQEMGGMVVYADAEVALGVDRMVHLGVDPNRLIYSDINTVDEAFDLLKRAIDTKNKLLGKAGVLTFIWDSVAAIATKDELEATPETKDYPRAAAAISKALRWAPRVVAENNVCLILINQTREKLGQMFGDGVSTYGGKAIKFYASLRLELENRAKLKAGTEIIGVNTLCTTVKNRLGPPFQQALLPVYYDHGISEPYAVLEYLKARGIITVSGAWYSMTLAGEELKFQRKTFPEKFEEQFEKFEDLIWGQNQPAPEATEDTDATE